MSMGLAGMNAMPSQCNKCNIMINSLCPEKDAQWGDYCISKTLDKDDNIIKVDDNGKICISDKTGLEETAISAYYILSDNVDEIIDSLIEEALLPYDERPIHNKSFIYEAVTGHELLVPEQVNYDVMLEEIELTKFSKIISSDAENLDKQYHIQKTKNDGRYIPDDFGLPIVDEKVVSEIKNILKDQPECISIREDSDGYFGINIKTGYRTYSVDDVNDIVIESIRRSDTDGNN